MASAMMGGFFFFFGLQSGNLDSINHMDAKAKSKQLVQYS